MFHVFSKPNCPSCEQAKALLTSKQLPFKEFILDVGQDRVLGKTYVQREEVLSLFPGARTMPQIALVGDDSKFEIIGGLTELKQRLS
jgi:glutaredoxin